MFCPKCGAQNANNTKFCRACGSNLSGVLAVVTEGKTLFAPQNSASADEYHNLFSSGIRNVVLGLGFLLISIFLFTLPPREGIMWLLLMFPAISLLASGVSRIVKANGIK